MRKDVVALILGAIILLMILPLSLAMLVTMFLDDPNTALRAFVIPIALSGALGYCLLTYFVRPTTNERLRDAEAFAAVALAWPVAVAIGALPYWLSGVFHGPFTDGSTFSDIARGAINSWFEAMSGFTTTGATVIDWRMSPNCINAGTDCINSQPKGVLLWRSMTQWLGGMGIIMIGMALLARILGGGMSLARAELTGPSLSRVRPRLEETAFILWAIYIGLTILEAILLYFVGGLSGFDAINHSLTTMPTGGFSTHDASIAYYDSIATETIIIVFMFIGGINFSLLALFVDGEWKRAIKDEEARYYAAILLLCILFTVGVLQYSGWEIGQAIRESAFTIVSIGTSSGYVNNDYTGNPWPTVALLILLFLMVMGASAGSTSGGLKVLRFNLAIKVAWRELSRIANPRQVKAIRMNDEVIEEDFISLIVGMLIVWMGIFIFSSLVMALLLPNSDFETIISVVATSLGNTGPALGSFGATDTWSSMNTPALMWTSALMWLGRLELLTALILLHPRTWRNEERDSAKDKASLKFFNKLFKRED
jgi:trk system potassium uptake protein TrkH